MKTVTKSQFFAYVGQRDIVLESHAHFTVWETRSGSVVGKTMPGWKAPGEESVYMLTESAIAELKQAATK